MRFTRTAGLLLGGAGAAALLFCGSMPCRAFDARVHWDVTKEALSSVSRTVGARVFTFTPLSIQEIRLANVSEDLDAAALLASHHFDDERLGDGSQRLIRLRRQIVEDISGPTDTLDGFSARRRLGAALHAIQDWYSHTNHVELGLTGILTELGRSAVPTPAQSLVVCEPDRATLLTTLRPSDFTSGYFDLPDACGVDAPAGKCLHGSAGCEGIHKDDESRTGFAKARELAALASIDFVNQILDDPDVAGDARALRTLMGRSVAFGLVVDDSVSMTASLTELRTTILDVIDKAPSLADGGGDFLLGVFGPGVEPVRHTVDVDEFKDWIDDLSPAGEPGDGAEPSMLALLRTVALARPGTTLFLVTDAKCADPELGPAVAGLARARGVQIISVLTGPDAGGDPCYRAISETSGGQTLHLPPDLMTKAFEILRAFVSADLRLSVAADGLMDGYTELPIPVECGVSRLCISATSDRYTSFSITASSPDAQVDDVTLAGVANGAIAQIVGPSAATWKLQFGGSGRYSFRVWSDGGVALTETAFVSRTNAAHAPLAPVQGLPAPGAPATLTLSIAGDSAETTFSLVDVVGAPISNLALVRQDPEAGDDRYVGTFVPPAQPFRVMASARDVNGCPCVRTFPQLFSTSDLSLSIPEPPASFVAGTKTTVVVKLVNDGAPGTFDLFAADDAARVTRVQPGSLTLGAGASGTFEVDVKAFGVERRNAIATLVVAAVEHSGGGRANTLTAEAPVTNGTLALNLHSASAKDKRKAKKDKFVAKGTMGVDAESRDGRIDILNEATRIEVGNPENPFAIDIPAGDARWTTSTKGVLTWRTAPGAIPAAKLTVDPRRRSFSLTTSKFDFPIAPGATPRVTLRIGDDVGTAARSK